MKKRFQRIKSWCNSNAGWLTAIFGLGALLPQIPFDKIGLSLPVSILDKFINVLAYKIQLPIYIVLASMIIVLLYGIILKSRYKVRHLTLNFFVGQWKKKWATRNGYGQEVILVDSEGHCYVEGQHYFDIVEFKFDEGQRRLTFTKKAVKPNDTRILKNILTITDNDHLIGQENTIAIEYIRIPS